MIDFYFTGPISLLSKYTVAGTKCSFSKVVAKSCENYDSFDLFSHRICMVCKAIINFFNFSKLHGLIACGGEDGAVECFDMRMRSSAARINAVAPAGDADQVSLSLSCGYVFCMFLLWELPSWDCISWEPKGLDSSMLHDFDKDYRSSICFKPVYILKVLFSIPFGKFYGSSAASISPYS